MEKIKIELTVRNFGIGKFKDAKHQPCSIQESSRADEPHLWLGCDEDRMEINRKTAKQLVKLLNRFIRTGRIVK